MEATVRTYRRSCSYETVAAGRNWIFGYLAGQLICDSTCPRTRAQNRKRLGHAWHIVMLAHFVHNGLDNILTDEIAYSGHIPAPNTRNAGLIDRN